jgi:hypothetical protein
MCRNQTYQSISPINVTRLPGHLGGLRGANASGSFVWQCTVNFRSHFLPQPSDVVKIFSLVQLLKESMTCRTGYVRGPTMRGRHAHSLGRLHSPLHGETLDRPLLATQSPTLISSPNPRLFSSPPMATPRCLFSSSPVASSPYNPCRRGRGRRLSGQ